MERYHDTPGRPPLSGHDATMAPDSALPCTDELEWNQEPDTPSEDGFDEADEDFDSDSDVEYWFWNGVRLVPASPDEAERLRQREEWERAERRLLAQGASGRRWGLVKMWRAVVFRLHLVRHVMSSEPSSTGSTGSTGSTRPAMDR